jgi:hypothetical protein
MVPDPEEFGQHFCPLTIPPSLNSIAPFVTDRLTRIGKINDGGYVIPESVIAETDFLISFGISDDWSFEEHFRQLKPTVHIHAYDHTVSAQAFAIELVFALARLLSGRGSFKDVLDRAQILKSYKAFFTGTVTHFRERIYNRVEAPFDVTLDKVFGRTTSSSVFLKIDIEGCEYRIIDHVIEYSDRIVGIVIEFHDTDPLRPVFDASIRKLQERFTIVHVHANNYGGVAQDNLPDFLELTCVRTSRVRHDGKRRNLPLPIVDYPNNPRKPDYAMSFL